MQANYKAAAHVSAAKPVCVSGMRCARGTTSHNYEREMSYSRCNEEQAIAVCGFADCVIFEQAGD
jgi:hypothetical protein